MYLLYLDGSGNVANPADDYIVLGGVAIYEAQIFHLARQLDLLAERIDPAAPQDVEFHGAPMLAGKKDIWRTVAKAERVEHMMAAYRLLAAAHPTVVLFGAAVHKASCFPDDPFEYAFEQLANRFDLLLRRKFLKGHNQKGLLIVDEDAYERRFQKLAIDFRTRGHRWGVLRGMVEVPLFVDSRASRLVQLADLVSYSLFRYYQGGDHRFLGIIQQRFDSLAGVVHGLVHFAPKGDHAVCPCPACARRRGSAGGESTTD
ncbi:DUF3800 domain-containing protein [Candidatus Poribacteria bacterium]|nr:DUF3800 domain-containing protein [Candidatus Poribacteria bacterium]